jgi:hypothetical protein
MKEESTGYNLGGKKEAYIELWRGNSVETT